MAARTLCLTNRARKYQLIKRDAAGNDLIVLDVLDDSNFQRRGIHLLDGLGGLYYLPKTQPIEKSAYGEGAKPSDTPRVNERSAQLRFGTVGKDPADWVYLETLLWRVLKVGKDTVLRIYDIDGYTWRELTIRLLESPVDQTKLQLGIRNQAKHTVDYFAGNPFWYGPLDSVNLKRSDMVLQPDGVTYRGYVDVWNPTDVECWLEWANGEETANHRWSIPDAVNPDLTPGRLVPLTPNGPLEPGQEFLVQTYPVSPRVMCRDDSLAGWANLRGMEFDNSLPAEMNTPVSLPVELVGGSETSQITCYMPRRWERFVGGESEDL